MDTNERWIPAEGTFPGVIVGFGDLSTMQSKPHVFTLQMHLYLQERKCVIYLAGGMLALQLISISRNLWIGKTIDVKIQHRTFQNKVMYHATPIWPEKL